MIKRELEALLVALFVPRCASCDKALPTRPQHGLCDVCFEVLEPNIGARCSKCDLESSSDSHPCTDCHARPPPFTRLRAPYLYGGPIADLIVAAKFRRREDLAVAAGELLADDEEAREIVADATCLVPVPLSKKRGRERGYNQSAVIARTLARRWRLPVVHALERRRHTGAQTDRSLAARRENVAGAFTVRRGVSGKVVLVDDVVTSTETVRAASGTLVDAAEIIVVALARAPLHTE